LKPLALSLLALAAGLAGPRRLIAAATTAPEVRLTLNFNPDWRFTKSDPAGSAAPDFDDSGWTRVSTPHTYNDIDTFDHWSTPGHRGEQIQWSGRTWYRKTFEVPASWKGRKMFIEFGAARQVAEVYLNGHLLGVSKTGFTPFGFDLSDGLRYGGANVLAVMCDNRYGKDPLGTAADTNLAAVSRAFNEAIPEKIEDLQAWQIPWNNPHWHPAHGGLFRDVRAYVTDPLHITLPLYSFLATAGPYAYATDISAESARITVEVPIENGRSAAGRVETLVTVADATGSVVLRLSHADEIAAGGRTVAVVSGILANPILWGPVHPHIYTVHCSLTAGGAAVDASEVSLGVRSARWSATEGLFLNGSHLKLHGWGQKPTDEWPGLGAAQPDWMHDYTLELMQAAGGNFVRWGHCAAGDAQITGDDRLGLLTEQPGVDGESDTVKSAWKLRVQAFRDMIIYFRNHPSIVIWEGGNQKVTAEHAHELRALMDLYDPHGGRAYAHRRADEATAAVMDVGIGTEGGREIARLPVVEGEYDREESPRRVWDDQSPPNFGYPEAKGQTYQLTSEQYAVNEISQAVGKIAAAHHSGGANWIFSDSTSGGRVSVEVARAGGEVDGVRLPKEAYYACQVMFRNVPAVHLIGHWTYPPGTKKTLFAVAVADDVQLRLNGRLLGPGKRSEHYLYTFPDVVWEPGTLAAEALIGGQVVATDTRRTAGPAAALRITSITGPGGFRADGSDVALFDVEAVDASGERCPTFQKRVDFTCTGPAIWRGGYNSGRIDSINHTYLDLEAGINRISVRATRDPGTVTIGARCEGLIAGSASVSEAAFPAMGGWTMVMPATEASLAPVEPAAAAAFGSAASARPAGVRAPRAAKRVGDLIATLDYSGPAGAKVRVARGATAAKPAYIDADILLPTLPSVLEGGEWIQTSEADRRYQAEDLLQLSTAAACRITVAHDSRLPRPGWLSRLFTETGLTLELGGAPMTLDVRAVPAGQSLTLGSNDDSAANHEGRMYLVFATPESRATLLAAMNRVADYQLAHPARPSFSGWIQGAFLAGLSTLERIDPSERHRAALETIAANNEWRLGSRLYMADDLCVGQTYLEMYGRSHDPRLLAPTQSRCDAILAKPSVGTLDFKAKDARDRWSWCDALFMAPPVWMRLYAITGNKAYMDYAIAKWWETSDFLYDPAEHLYFRDSTFFAQRSPNGKKVFWSRGNGWVMAGLARVIPFLPANDPSLPRFEAQFRDMAEKIRSLQQADGSWRANLLDPEDCTPAKETSGTGFFCYAFAWGVNRGLLNRATFEPAAKKAWAALLTCVTPEGKLEYVQPVGSAPTAFPADSTAPYGPGALILAGSELMELERRPR